MSAIYIHIPYCKQKCTYCNFYFKTNLKDKNKLIESLIKEISLTKDYLKNNKLKSLYLGGGTPSVMNKESLGLIFRKVQEYYQITSETETTIECNPEDLSIEKLNELKDLGFNRLSIGIQSFKDQDLIFMNRNHNRYQAINSVKNAKKVGFKNISIDLIFSLPNQSLKDWNQNLKIAFELDIQHISSYSLTIEEKTKLKYLIDKKKVTELVDIDSSNHFKLLVNECGKRGFIQYEISNFGKKNYFSTHNSNYWIGSEYLGIGPSAHSYNGKSRSWNISNNSKYINSINDNIIPSTVEKLTNSEKFNDYMMTSLRTMWGSDLVFIKKKFGHNIYYNLNHQIQKWIKSKDIYQEKNKIYLTTKGKFISDSICSDLFIVD
ncbi:MAG: coproporphyrinogen III oxidase [Flavobacteriales bacterium]|nr:coproporphyrinogen III oxidase [Flavobacteriales bacterium]